MTCDIQLNSRLHLQQQSQPLWDRRQTHLMGLDVNEYLLGAEICVISVIMNGKIWLARQTMWWDVVGREEIKSLVKLVKMIQINRIYYKRQLINL